MTSVARNERRGDAPWEVFANMRSREDVPSAVVEKMLSDNPRNLYGLPE
jgi:hypothetical protein